MAEAFLVFGVFLLTVIPYIIYRSKNKDTEPTYEYKKTIETNEEYRDLIRSRRITSIAEIASRVNKKIPVVEKEIQELIDSKYFLDMHIDKLTETIVFSAGPSIDSAKNTPKQDNSELGILCKNCGAINSVFADKCAYCDTPLNH